MPAVVRLDGDDSALVFENAVFEDERSLGRYRRDYWFECDVTLAVAGEERVVHLEMIEPYREDMLGFFEQLAEAKAPSRHRWESEYAELHLDVVIADDGPATFDAEIWWPPDYERRERAQFQVATDQLPGFAERLREFVRLDQGERLKPAS